MSKQSYIPGDKWLYYKIYCGVKTSDEVITQIVLPLSLSLKEQGLINKWFFIRYSDPDLHLRIRFQFESPNGIGTIMSEMNNRLMSFIESNKIWKVMLDTYRPEIERYHPDLISHAENLFWFDSETTGLFLDSIEGDEGEKIRWMFAFRNVDILLTDFGLSLEQKQNFMMHHKEAFAAEFGMNKNFKLQLDQKYRNIKADILGAMNLNAENAGDHLPLVELLAQRTSRNLQVVTDIKEIAQKNEDIDIQKLLSSYVHMTINRIFRSKQRMHEMVIYDFLYRHYKSTIAQRKSTEKNLTELAS